MFADDPLSPPVYLVHGHLHPYSTDLRMGSVLYAFLDNVHVNGTIRPVYQYSYRSELQKVFSLCYRDFIYVSFHHYQ